ncbi:hypothetical protein [Streptomyces erythrochromogenes]|uniref:hypothetical protein n=1 Tax=Streptomyces erythrochromogenes TaxID=285574 RepID=UPI0036D01BFF
MNAIDLLQRHLDQPLKEGAFFDPAESVPLAGVVPGHWRAAVVGDKSRIERVPYELCVLVALRDAVRRREIWVLGADRWRNPEDDLPADFEDNRDVHDAALGVLRGLAGPLRAGADGGHDGRGGDREEAQRAVDQGLPTGEAGGAPAPGGSQG